MEGRAILSFLTSNAELLLVSRDMPYVSEPKNYDLLLTPQFYIYKKESLPIKYSFQAAKLAPSILEELTGNGNYSYAAIKDGDDWAFYAYDMAEIESFLKSKRLDSQYINKIYFAQQIAEYLNNPIKLDEKNALTSIDGTAVVLPQTLLESKTFQTLDESFRPEKSITPPQSRNSAIPLKQTIILSSLMAILGIGYLIEGVGYKKSSQKIIAQIEETKSKYPSLRNRPSMIINNIYNGAHKVDIKERAIREKLKDISHLLGKGSKIDTLRIGKDGYDGVISVDNNKIKDIERVAKKDRINAKLNGSTFVLKGSI